jgi:hypothetical protein
MADQPEVSEGNGRFPGQIKVNPSSASVLPRLNVVEERTVSEP